MSTEVDDFFAHYGVKGMHWGAHRGLAPQEIKSRGKPQEQHRTNRFNSDARKKRSLIKISSIGRKHHEPTVETAGGANYLKRYGSSGGRIKKGNKFTKDQVKKLKNVGITAGAVGLAAGAAYGAYMLKNKAQTPLASLPKVTAKASSVVKNSSNVKYENVKSLASEYAKNPAASDWLRQASPAAYQIIMSTLK